MSYSIVSVYFTEQYSYGWHWLKKSLWQHAVRVGPSQRACAQLTLSSCRDVRGDCWGQTQKLVRGCCLVPVKTLKISSWERREKCWMTFLAPLKKSCLWTFYLVRFKTEIVPSHKICIWLYAILHWDRSCCTKVYMYFMRHDFVISTLLCTVNADFDTVFYQFRSFFFKSPHLPFHCFKMPM